MVSAGLVTHPPDTREWQQVPGVGGPLMHPALACSLCLLLLPVRASFTCWRTMQAALRDRWTQLQRKGDSKSQPSFAERRAPWSAKEVTVLPQLGLAYTGKDRWNRMLNDHACRPLPPEQDPGASQQVRVTPAEDAQK